MIRVLKNGTVYAPEKLGVRDILVVGGKIVRIAEHIDEYDNIPDAEIFDLSGKTVTPGYVDIHVHITGAGGAAGFSSRAPEASTKELVQSGITTVLGMQGTDGVSRSLENLLAKTRAINEDGLTAYMLTGSYGYPSNNLFGTVERDVVLIQECIGVKIATSDHRSNNPGTKELIQVATDARRGGMLSGVAGLTTVHMGAGEAALEPVLGIFKQSDVPFKNVLPTHVTRAPKLMSQAMDFIRMGGTVDVTVGIGEDGWAKVGGKIMELLACDEDHSHVTMTSDGYRSGKRIDGRPGYASPLNDHFQLRWLVQKGGLPLEEALKLLTVNPARMIAKTGVKGCIAVGADADILVMDEDMKITDLFAMGKTAMQDGIVYIKGKFEE